MISTLSSTLRHRLIAGFVALALSVCWFFQMRTMALGNYENTCTPFEFIACSHNVFHICPTNAPSYFLVFTNQTFNNFTNQPNVWKARYPSLLASGKVLDAFAWSSAKPIWTISIVPGLVSLVPIAGGSTLPFRLLPDDAFRNIFGFYQAAGLLAVFGLLILFLPKPHFIILGTFAGIVSLYLTPPTSSAPYDMPTMFMFTLSFLLWRRGWLGWMLLTVIAGSLIKETVSVTAVLFFFTRLDWRRRLGFFVVAAIGCALVKSGMSLYLFGHPWLSTIEWTDWTRLKQIFLGSAHGSLQWLRSWVWCNAGLTFAAVFLLPQMTLEDRGCKWTTLAFLVGSVFAGDYGEFRDFLELLPMLMIYLWRVLERTLTGTEP